MITRVLLRGWKSHLDTELGFSPGVNVLVGVMGSGKSSVMQAICFALYGTFPELQSRKVSLPELIMKKPQSRDAAEVCLEFSVGGKGYTARRVIRRKGASEAEIREDGRLLDATPQGVSREVERILGMDYDLFCRAVYSEQNQMDYFLRVPRGQRTQQIDRMLQVDRFEAVREQAVSAMNRLSLEAREGGRVLDGMRREGLEGRKEQLEREMSSMAAEAGALRREAGRLREEEQALLERIGSLERGEAEAQKARQELEGVLAGLREVGSVIGAARAKSSGRGAAGLEAAFASAARALSELERESGERSAAIEAKRAALADSNAAIRALSEGIKGLEGMGAACPLCESPISGERKALLLGSRKAEEARLRAAAARLGTELERERGLLEEAERGMRKAVQERERLSSALEQVRSVEGMEQRRARYEERKAALEGRLSAMEAARGGAGLAGLRNQLRDRTSERSAMESRAASLAQRALDRESMIREVAARIEAMRRHEAGIRRSERAAEGARRFSASLKLTQDQLREEFLRSVNAVMAGVWEELYPYSDFTGIRLLAENDYVLQLRDSTGWIPVDGMASGGERSMASLALRVAFSLAFVPNLKWLILDEPTHNLDANAIRRFAASLREGLAGFAEQVFLITHDERISEGVDSVHRLERDKGRDGATTVVQAS
jgi:exonuclease SbcC